MFSFAILNMADDGESLESWLNKATNPSNRHEDWEYIMGFCDQINSELEGPQISIRLLAHKIQSPQEWEAMQALTVLEACMKNCGQRFHNEVGKFKFLNELIKIVAPKYLGDRASEKVKKRVIEMLYTWTVSLPDETKIREAYQTLKLQGIVSVDPEISADPTLIPPTLSRPKNPVFEDKKKSMRLAELLKSKKPEDLQEANRLIKNMVKENEARTQKVARQKSTLEAADNSVRLLNEMLAHFSAEGSTAEDKELIKDLYNDCDKLRQTIFQLATETEDDDSSLGDILQASDDLSHVINAYRKIVEGHSGGGDSGGGKAKQTSNNQDAESTNQSNILIDLGDAATQTPDPPKPELTPPSESSLVDLLFGSASSDPNSVHPPTAAASWLDEELLSLEAQRPGSALDDSARGQSGQSPPPQASGHNLDLFDIRLPSVPAFSAPALLPADLSTAESNPTVSVSSFPDLAAPPPSVSAAAGRSAPQSHGVTPSPATAPAPQLSNSPAALHSPLASLAHNSQDLPMLDLGGGENDAGAVVTSVPAVTAEIQSWSPLRKSLGAADDCAPLFSRSPRLPTANAAEASLSNLFIPLEAVKPSQVTPVTAYDRNGVRVLLHFSTDCPPGRPDVLVMVASMLSTAPHPVRSIVLQAAVPKMMKIKLQPPSGTELAPFNPILPPPAITQVILLANPLKERTRMRYKLTFTLGEQPFSEVGEVDEFPPADRWGAL